MNDNLQRWASIAEIVSSVAVLVTLLFLIFEIRTNSNLIRANAFEDGMRDLENWRYEVIDNEATLEVATDLLRAESPDDLRKTLLALNLWNIYESAYYSREYGLIAAEGWERYKFGICANYTTDKAYWDSIGFGLTPEFREFVPEFCETQ